MVPARGIQAPPSGRLPRASGDGPWSAFSTPPASASPPRERGWSLFPVVLGCSAAVSPARAGMVPGPKTPAGKAACLPRASGDGPFRESLSNITIQSPPRERGWSPDVDQPGTAQHVSPARAGMVPAWARHPGHCSGLPRASGDGPLGILDAELRARSPPRERGWSHNRS